MNVDPEIAGWAHWIRRSGETCAAAGKTFRRERPAPGGDRVPGDRRLAAAARRAYAVVSDQADGLPKMIAPKSVGGFHRERTRLVRDDAAMFSRMKRAADENDLRRIRSSDDGIAAIEIRAAPFVQRLDRLAPPVAL